MCLKKKSDGVLIIDLNNNEVPIQINFNIDISKIISKKQIVLDVDQQAYTFYKNYISFNDKSERSSMND